ncbi:MAG: dihydrodipicolinate synthase family protein [Gammaproteobacteria bacterium]|nr:dihydrodipicolinate synthase family protein [Gammaproteobacteria bacterium]
MLLGSLVDLILPLKDDFTIDQAILRKLVRLHFAAFTDGVLLSHAITELRYLTPQQREEVIRTVAEELASRLPLIVETTGPKLETTLDLSLEAQLLGADACLIAPHKGLAVTDLYDYFIEIARQIAIPIVLHDVQGSKLTPNIIAKLIRIGNIVGILEESSDLIRAQKIEKLIPEHVGVYAGDDASAMEFVFYGAQGAVSATANVAPKAMFDLCKASLTQDRLTAEKKNLRLFPLYEQLDTGSPVAIKCALHMMGLIASEASFLGNKLTEENKDRLKQSLKLAGML